MVGCSGEFIGGRVETLEGIFDEVAEETGSIVLVGGGSQRMFPCGGLLFASIVTGQRI